MNNETKYTVCNVASKSVAVFGSKRDAWSSIKEQAAVAADGTEIIVLDGSYKATHFKALGGVAVKYEIVAEPVSDQVRKQNAAIDRRNLAEMLRGGVMGR